MKYLILDGPTYPVKFSYGAYRGTDRKYPPCINELSADSEVNRWGLWYVNELEAYGGIRDLARAREYLRFCNQYFPDMQFDLIGISTETEASSEDARLLGFDIFIFGRQQLAPIHDWVYSRSVPEHSRRAGPHPGRPAKTLFLPEAQRIGTLRNR